MIYEIELIDGINVQDDLCFSVFMKPLTDKDKQRVLSIADEQFIKLKSYSGFQPVNDKHESAIQSLIFLNEHTSASIHAIGVNEASYTYDDIRSLRVSAQDWNVILSAGMALDECYNGETIEMLA
ncbi:hypothetical protein [Vibrio parahaemolyticus]|uniref:hypothetical protein n=1 Tax=Vibrio parahaemolyticus TaxID=670 RepID=UPI002361FB42|nr:hypothetical protein [Vibrio parahaemolyticus]